MARARRRAPRTPYMEPRKYFLQKLVLNQWLLTRFGLDAQAEYQDGGVRVRPIARISKTLRGVNAGLDAGRHHHYLNALMGHWQPDWHYSEQDLRRFDANIVAHTDVINQRRTETIQWKYFQWLSLLFVEIYLHEYFRDREALKDSLNEQVRKFDAHWQGQGFETGITEYGPDDLNKLCLQNATGSGKTLLMHVNVLQFRHYARKHHRANDYGRVILVTPNERLTDQHLEELRISDLHGERLAQDTGDLLSGAAKALGRIELSEITKLGEEQGVKTMAVDSFGDANLLLVDEGHRGLGRADERGWLSKRDKLAARGFTFEYSATFKEAVVAAGDRRVENTYAKSILFDYAYRYFYEDGYGKDYRIFNLPSDLVRHQRNYLTAALVTFYQQRRLYDDRKHDFVLYNLHAPLWVFVGASVVTDAGEKVSANQYQENASDVAKILGFLAWFLANKAEAVEAIEAVVHGSAQQAGLVDDEGQDIFGASFPFIKNELDLSADALYADILARVFRTQGGGTLVVERITGDSGELLLKVGENPDPFGLINVGDAPGLADHLDALAVDSDLGIDVRKSEFANPIFAEVATDRSPVNLLIGSKKFIEGWNCWRVSSMGLMNTGKKEGSQIIQLFGRGVRLMGRDMSLKRSSRYDPALVPKHLHLLETLNVFGVGADFMATFREFLREEGLPGNDKPELFYVKLNVTKDVGKQLKMLRPKVRKDTAEVYSFPKHGPLVRFGGEGDDLELTPDITVKGRLVIVDRYPRVAAIQADGISADQAAAAVPVPNQVSLDGQRLAFLSFGSLYLDLERYIKQRGYANLLVSPERLRPLLESTAWYRLLVPQNLWSLSMANVPVWQAMALEALCQLADRVFNYHKRAYLEPRLELVPLNEASGNLPDQNEYQLLVSGDESALVDDIKELKKAFDQDEKDTCERVNVAGLKLDIHLYNPVLTARSDRIKILPVSLNDSEYRFVQDLKDWLKRNPEELAKTGERLYLLRNLVRHGIGFFEAGGFWPDFILWRVQGKKQRIVFVDPHGLQHEGPGSDKIEFYAEIKRVEQRLGDKDVTLESAILSPPKTPELVIAARWKLNAEELRQRHVFFMADAPAYLDRLMAVVRG